MQAINTVLSLDVGTTRTGVAIARMAVGIASPLTTLEVLPDQLAEAVVNLVKTEAAEALVIGMPRNLNGDDTEQTRIVRQIVHTLQKALTIPVYEQDEALTSKQDEDELKQRGKPYSRGDIDALAATYILQDFIESHPELRS